MIKTKLNEGAHTVSSDWINRWRFRLIDTQPKNRSNGLNSGPGISFCGCGHGRHSVSNASCVKSVGTAPAHERAGMTRDKCGALAAKRNIDKRIIDFHNN